MDDQVKDKKEEVSEVVDAEIVEDASANTTLSPVDELKNIENLINANITKMDKLVQDLKPVKEMLESLLQADLEYAELDQKAVEATKDKTKKKKELMGTTNGKELTEKLKELKQELLEAKDALSSYLQEYQKKTGFNEYEGPDGELRQIVFSAKLVRKTKLNLDYYIDQVIDMERQEEIVEYFREDAESGSVEAALQELGEEDYTEEDIRLMRIKFLSEYGN